MLKKKKIILSFDYELFFGDKSGTVMESLIKPTNLLLDAMDSVGFKGNFFIDWLMLKYLKAENTERTDADYKLIVDQIQDMVRRGHRIELHIHPHWVDAKYKGDGTWDFSEFKHYCLSSFKKVAITQMFTEGVDFLTTIVRKIDPYYNIVAFRAGGWAVNPFELIKEGMIRSNIQIDSSVMAGIGVRTAYSECIFTDIRTPKSGYYRFENDVKEMQTSGQFIEIPISACERGLVVKVVSKLTRMFKIDFTPLTDGTHNRRLDVPDRWFNPSGLGVFTLSNITPLEILVRHIFSSSPKYTCYIDHPKDFTLYTIKGIKTLSKISQAILYSEILQEINYDYTFSSFSDTKLRRR